MTQVKIKNKSKYPLPKYETEGAAGLDVYANESVNIKPNDVSLVPTGLFCEIPNGYEIQVRPRSGFSLKKKGFVANSPGTIDSDYRGEIKVIIYNANPYELQIEEGERVAQLVIAKVERLEWVETDTLSDTERNEKGFGHTGT